MLYTSVQNPKIKDLYKLHEKKYRDKTGLFLVEGKHLVLEAYQKGNLKEVFLLEGEQLDLNIPTSHVSMQVMKYLSSLESTASMIGLCAKREEQSFGDKIVILENIQDPGNVGTIIRSAVAFGASSVILTKGCADPYSSKVIRSTQGMLFHIPVIQKDVDEIREYLKKEKIPLIGTKIDGGNSLKKIEKNKKFAIIMGNEGTGVRNETLEMCDSYVYIPMNPACESLNVGVAASIILYELDKRG